MFIDLFIKSDCIKENKKCIELIGKGRELDLSPGSALDISVSCNSLVVEWSVAIALARVRFSVTAFFIFLFISLNIRLIQKIAMYQKYFYLIQSKIEYDNYQINL